MLLICVNMNNNMSVTSLYLEIGIHNLKSNCNVLYVYLHKIIISE